MAKSVGGTSKQGDSRAPQQKPKAGAESQDFAAQMQAQATLLAGAQAQPQAMPSVSSVVSKEGSQAADQSQRQMKALEGKPATSPNTGATIAGLQPSAKQALLNAVSAKALPAGINKEWVFEGADRNPDLKGLFESAPGAEAALQGMKTAGQDAQSKVMTPQTDALARAAALSKARSEMAMKGAEGAPQLTGGQPDLQALMSATVAKAPAGMKGGQAGQVAGSARQASHDNPGDGDIALDPEMLSQFGGGISINHLSARAGAHVNGPTPQGSHALSGAEFLSTLASVRGGGAMSSGSSGSDTGAGGQAGAKAGIKLNVQEGLKKSKTLESGEPGFETLVGSGGATVGGTAGFGASNGASAGSAAQSAEMQAHVAKGAMAQDRLATDSVLGLSANIRGLTPQGGGEIRVRLHPENLGELHLRVVTDGKQVGLQIQASDEKAKKILESSIHDLKDSLASHQLSLGSVDFVVAQTQQSSSSNLGSDSQPQSQHPAFGGMQDMMNGQSGGRSDSWNGGGHEAASSRENWNASPLRTATGGRMAATAGASGSSAAGSRRLDVRA